MKISPLEMSIFMYEDVALHGLRGSVPHRGVGRVIGAAAPSHPPPGPNLSQSGPVHPHTTPRGDRESTNQKSTISSFGINNESLSVPLSSLDAKEGTKRRRTTSFLKALSSRPKLPIRVGVGGGCEENTNPLLILPSPSKNLNIEYPYKRQDGS